MSVGSSRSLGGSMATIAASPADRKASERKFYTRMALFLAVLDDRAARRDHPLRGASMARLGAPPRRAVAQAPDAERGDFGRHGPDSRPNAARPADYARLQHHLPARPVAVRAARDPRSQAV